MSRVFARAHRDNGVDLVLHAGIQALRGVNRVESVVTTDGRVFEADLVLVGIGVLPNADIAAAARLDVDETMAGAVVVDASLRTSDPDVFAAGDVCAWPCAPLGNRRIHDPATAQLVTRGDVDGREFMAFWLVDGRLEAGMHVNVWDTIEDVQTLIRSGRTLEPARLADPDVSLGDV
jgi:3-phenylpropionate/trans-cinnamate dioxygenase ferredoxin reductase subunit